MIYLSKENFSKGITARDGETGLILDLYIILGYGIKMTEILVEVQKKVKYVVESTLDVNVEAVNVYVQGFEELSRGDKNMQVLTGKLFKEMVLCGANTLHNNHPEIDALNVFPVPDGDTGNKYVNDFQCRCCRSKRHGYRQYL